MSDGDGRTIPMLEVGEARGLSRVPRATNRKRIALHFDNKSLVQEAFCDKTEPNSFHDLKSPYWTCVTRTLDEITYVRTIRTPIARVYCGENNAQIFRGGDNLFSQRGTDAC